MSSSKFYAVHTPDADRIVETWAECEQLTHGVSGNLYKSFATRADAQEWLDNVSIKYPADMLRVYVDGSYVPGCPKAGWAFVAVENGIEIASGSGITDMPAESRNIDGELAASLHALEWLKCQGRDGIICHDYEGIARWAKGEWLAKTPVAVRYREAVRAYPNAKFEKVPAHSGIRWNEMADGLARAAILAEKSRAAARPQSPESTEPDGIVPILIKTAEGLSRAYAYLAECLSKR